MKGKKVRKEGELERNRKEGKVQGDRKGHRQEEKKGERGRE